MFTKKRLVATATALAMMIPLAACSSGGLGSGGGSSAAPSIKRSADPAVLKAARDFKGTFTYWTGLTFPDAGNKIEEQRIEQWGKNLGIAVQVVAVNQNDTSQRVAAALQSGAMPDALTIGYDLAKVMAGNKQLAPVDDVFKSVGTDHGGWFDPIKKATTDKSWGGDVYGVPLGFFGNVLFRRTDLLKAAGYTNPPTTWQQFTDQATKVTSAPKVYGAGLSLGNVLDGNEMTAIMQSFGGRVANNSGTTCTLDTPQVKKFLTWVTNLYKNKVIPPDSVTWNGASDNNAYLAGGAGFIVNTGSVYLSMLTQDPQLLEDTAYSALPAGPIMTVNPVDIRYRVIPTSTKSNAKILAKDLFRVLSADDYNKQYMAEATYGPVLKSQASYPIFEKTAYAALLTIAKSGGTAPAYPDVANIAFSDYQNSFSTPHMIQRVVTDGLSIDAAAAEAQANCQKIYNKYNK
ncbi:MAG: extracellular solute-binding protein [Microbacteriaceae bacterium]|nr:MAG: extracellular solute-binding protein [Microbacteriaceae bacterium]